MTHSQKSPELGTGSILGRYELLLPIAKGGMAQVWAARLCGSRGFQKLVAVKTILSDVIDNTRLERMFLEEAQLASRIHHPNVVGTLELGEHEGTLYLVMDWVDGEPLNRVMAKAHEHGGLPLPIAVNLIGQACRGLYAAHELRDDNGDLMGLVHRDVSPQNLLIGFSGTAKLVDFGIAKATARSSGLTEAGEVKGKFAFMAPEQVRGQPVDCRTDLFALGIVLYSITTGKHPFRGAHPGETLQNVCSERAPTPPSALLPDYPEALEAVVMKALAKSPEQRFANGSEMLLALEDAMPAPLDARFERQVAEYMNGLFGTQPSERRAAIRLAQVQIDRQRADASSSSVGTLRAISIERQDSGNFAVNPSVGPIEAPPQAPIPVPVSDTRSRRQLMAVGAVLSLSVFVLAFQLRHGSAPAASSAAASRGPPGTLLPAPTVAPMTRPVAPAAAPAAPNSAPENRPGSELAAKREHTVTRPSHAPSLPPKAQPTPPSTAPELAPATATSSAAPAPAIASSNAWNRGAFGGRH